MARAYPGRVAEQRAMSEDREAREVLERLEELERAHDALVAVVAELCAPSA
jgi:hypothetical protein